MRDSFPNEPFVDIRSDEARILYRRHLEERFAEQRRREAGTGSVAQTLSAAGTEQSA
jgi:hypothetical protein